MPPFIIALIALVVSTLLMALLMKPNRQKPAALQDWTFPLWEDGTPEVVLFGDAWIKGPMVTWYGNYRTIKIKASGAKK